MNQFPDDFPHALTGFGGDPRLNRAQHRERCRKCPVLLVHGNAANSVHHDYGMQKQQEFLKEIGYQDCEIWAMDYLGENNGNAIIDDVHRNHIDAFRKFVDDVRAYLGVQKLDFIAHSLGCGMVNAYLRGLQANGAWNYEDHRLGVVGTFVSIAGAQYGLGRKGNNDFTTGGRFEVLSHRFGDVPADDTPAGSDDRHEQEVDLLAGLADAERWKTTTPLDGDEACYVAIIAHADFVDAQLRFSSRREGAHLNREFELGPWLSGHKEAIRSRNVFDAFRLYLNRHPPVPPVTFSVDKQSGNYGADLRVTLTVAPADAAIGYTARRLTKAVEGGFLREAVVEELSGVLANGQALTLAQDGAWDVRFATSTGDAQEFTYGVNVHVPIVEILTPDTPPFQGSLDVLAKTSKGIVHHSTDRVRWLAESRTTIHETTTLYFIAIDADGLASPVVSRAYEKKAAEFVRATLTEHFVAHRLTVDEYIGLTRQLGANAVITLYFVNGAWVLDPDTREVALAAPELALSDDGGVKTEPFVLTLAAHHPSDAAPAIYYTLDGSQPTRHSHRFTAAGSIAFDSAGTRTVRCRACDAAGNWSDTVTRTYRLEFDERRPRIHCDRPGGAYARAFHAVVAVAGDPKTVVHYTEDGSDPSDPANPNRKSFEGRKRFSIHGNGHHAILCHARDADGNEALEAFGWRIDDHDYPETRIAPAAGGTFADNVRIELGASRACEWTRYTLDGSEPSDTNGTIYTGPILLDRSARLRYRSRGFGGKLEPVRTATFIVTARPDRLEFVSDPALSGDLVAQPDGAGVLVGPGRTLRIGTAVAAVSAPGGRPAPHGDSRAILQFDTSSLPDNVTIVRACLEVAFHGKSGDPWGAGRTIEIDVQRGHFGSSRALHGGDWAAPATAEGVARIGRFSAGTYRSADFSVEGLAAINKTGVTQVRLRMAPPPGAQSDACLVLEGGASARLHVTLAGGG